MKKTTLLLLLLLPMLCFAQYPDWQWSRNLSVASNSGRQYTAIDNQGNIYLIGDFQSATMTIGSTTLTNTAVDFWDIYVVKYDKDANIIWAKSFGGADSDGVIGIATDPQGNFYITGVFQYNITIGATTLTNLHGNSFFAKFDSDGNALWAKTHEEASGIWIPNDVTTDASGNMYITGSYGLPTLTFGGVTLTNDNYIDHNHKDAFVGKFDSNGNCIWLRDATSTVDNLYGSDGYTVKVDSAGNVYMAGRFNNATINFGTVTLTKTAEYDYNANMFIVKYNPDGVAQWGKNTGTIYKNLTHANTLATDESNNVFVSGFFSNDIHFDAITLTAFGGSKPYTAKFDPNGNTLWAKAPVAGQCAGINYSSDTDSEGCLYVAGFTSCPTIDFGNGVTLNITGDGAFYVVKYNAAGNAVWARKSSATNINNEASIDVKNENEMYVAGTFWSPTLTFGNNAPLVKSETNYNLFIAKLFYQPLATPDFNADSFSVSPNPVGNALFVNDLPGICRYSLYDTAGRQVLQGIFENTNEILETSSLNTGMYLLRLQNESGAYAVKKILKQ